MFPLSGLRGVPVRLARHLPPPRRRHLALLEAEIDVLRRSEESLRLLFDGIPQPMYVFAVEDLRVLAANRTALEFYGYTEAEMLRLTLDDLDVVPEHGGMCVQHRRRDGTTVHVEVHSRPLVYQGVPAKLTLVVDITERRALEGELQHQALHDSLTGLPNRALFLDRLGQLLSRRDPAGAVLLLDLDGFKHVNDSLGHNAGDQLLVAVAGRLLVTVRPGDTVARLGGDEFGVILDGFTDPADVHGASTRLLEVLGEPYQVGDRAVQVTGSAGVVLSGEGHLSGGASGADAVLAEADIAMYAAKASGKGGYRVFSPAMHAGVLDRAALEQDLRRAVALSQLRVLYQPKVDTRTGRISSAEALVRWLHPTRGMVPPDRFIGLAEEIGMIGQIDAWVLDAACAQAAAWRAAGLLLDHVAVNVSGRELAGGGLYDRIAGTLDRHRLPGVCLEIELTESTAVQQADTALGELARIRGLGVSVAIDDFGTGYSMLSRLQDFPLDRLKIDKSFVAGIEGDGAAPLVVAMIGMGHELGLQVVAEGVETSEQLRFLRNHGCDQLQGYLLSCPIEATALEHVLGQPLLVGLDPLDVPRALQAAADVAASRPEPRRLVHVLLSELERLTGLESTYVTRIDARRGVQTPVEVRNRGDLHIPAGAVVALEDTLCMRVMEDRVSYVRSVSESYPDAAAARALGIETFVTVPVRNDSGELVGTLCGASRRRVDLPDSVVGVMTLFAGLISRASAVEGVAAA